ncbi:MAG: TonB-dependent receptor [Vicinamibacterales bacterium]
MKNLRRSFALVCVLLAPTAARAQQALPDLSLEELMRIDAGRVFGASERIQPVTEAPASVSFITAEEIAQYGYRTLADILNGVRGMYVSDDRAYSLVGTRGFAKPGDYNRRILLLVNGHRVNDGVFGQAQVGAEFGIDPSMFERVEVIRGPASSIYGDSAFFAVVNVITKSGASLNGTSVTVETGSLGLVSTRLNTGRRFTNGLEMAFSGTYLQRAGNEHLYFPVYDTPANNNGVADNLDAEDLGQWYGQLRYKTLTMTAAYGRRHREVPTAPFGTKFNEQAQPEEARDRHTFLDAEYGHAFGANRVVFRGSLDHYSNDRMHPFATRGPVLLGHSSVVGSRWTAGARLTRALPGRQILTAGAEFIDQFNQNQRAVYVDPARVVFDIQRSTVQSAVYVQDEVKFGRWVIVNGGLRYDRYEDFTRATPRAALIVMPSANQSFKYLYGRAFRAPSAYEFNDFYFGPKTADLNPESVDTHEVVWERYTNDWLRTSVSTYWYKADHLITLTADPTTFLGTTFINAGNVRAKGLELEAQMRLVRGLQGLMSYAWQRAEDIVTDKRLANSPAQLAKFRVSIPGPTKKSSIAVEVLSMSSRKSIAGNRLAPATTASVTFVAPLASAFELYGGGQNLFDVTYADPASEQHRQDVIQRNGRTFNIGLRWKFGAK